MGFHYFLGIDVSKLTLDFALLNQEGKLLVQSQTQNADKCIQQLLEQLIKTHQIEPQQLLICLEHTAAADRRHLQSPLARSFLQIHLCRMAGVRKTNSLFNGRTTG